MADPTETANQMMVKALIGPFTVKAPPVKRHMVHGHLVPNLKKAFMLSKKRRLTIEIHSPPTSSDMIWDPVSSPLEDTDHVLFRLFRLSRDDHEEDDEDASVGTTSPSDDIVDEDGTIWKEHRKYTSDAVEILKVHGRTVEVKLGSGTETVVRDFRFDNANAATKFEEAMLHVQSLASDRAKRQIQAYKSNTTSNLLSSPRDINTTIAEGDEEMGDGINILVEIVSATDLPVADISSTDAYCIVRLKGKEIHRTEVISKDLSPIWTLENGSLFILKTTPEEFFGSTSGMTFLLKDYDAVGQNDLIGSVIVPLNDLLEGNGDRIEFDIVPDKSMLAQFEGKSPKLNLRFKRASRSDCDFMDAFADKNKKYGVYANETFLPLNKPNAKFLKRQSKKIDNQTVHRVKPGPDPDRPEDATKWMSSLDINKECMKPSTNWIEASSGTIGKVFLEVLKCDNLPNMDGATLNVKDKTDAFCCIVYEDCIVNTDVIADELSPRWMPWSQRAFVFNIANPSSNLFLGLFDFDPELAPGQLLAKGVSSEVHDAIGRVVLNMTNFRPGTTYVLHYNLYAGELLEQREKANGTVTVRLRIEHNDSPRQAMLTGLNPPEQSVVCVSRKIDFDVANFVADGAVDDKAFSLDTITRYLDELYTYEIVVDYINKAVMTVVLWRGHHSVTMCGKHLKLPLHSVIAYIWLNIVAWNYDRFPAFLVFCIAWLLLACNEAVHRHPSRWKVPPKYVEMLSRLVLNKSLRETIDPDENLAAIQVYEAKVAAQAKRRKEEAEKAEAHEAALQMELEAEAAKAEEAEDLNKKKGFGFNLNLLKPHLYPIQKELRKVVYGLRATKGVFLWGEAFYTFWIVTLCLFASLVFFFIPWSFFIQWTIRIVVFLALGPWMWLVDKYYLKMNPDMTDEEQDEAFRQRLAARVQEVKEEAGNLFVRKENTQKLKSFKRYMFGRHLVSVPRFSEDLYADFPLPSSSCAPTEGVFSVVPKLRKYGQALEGDMIPMREVQAAAVPQKKQSRKRKKKGTVKSTTEDDDDVPDEKAPLLGGLFRRKYKSTGNSKEE